MEVFNKEDFLMGGFTQVSNEMPFNKELKDIDIIVYIYAKRLINYRNFSLLNMEYIYSMLKANSRKTYTEIIYAFLNLMEEDLIDIYSTDYERIDINELKPKDNFIVVFNEENAGYFQVEDETIDKVIEYSKDLKSRWQFIRYYLMVRRSVNYHNGNEKANVGYLTMNSIKDFIKNKSTIGKYNNILSENNIFYVNNNYVSPKTYKNLSTYFGLCSDMTKKEFERDVQSFALACGYIEYDKEEISKKIKDTLKKRKCNL